MVRIGESRQLVVVVERLAGGEGGGGEAAGEVEQVHVVMSMHPGL